MNGCEVIVLASSEPESPNAMRNWNFGLRDLFTLHKSNLGRFVMIFEIWVSVNPWALKKESTKSGFFVVLRVTFLTTERADSWVRPHEFMR